MNILIAAAAYFAIVFAAGFALGAVRIVLLEPRLGPLAATLVELPLMLVISWFAARHVVRMQKFEARLPPRLAMGLLAFILLIGAEISLGVAVFGRTLEEQVCEMSSRPGLLGLGGQALFALIPAAMLWRARG